MTFDIVPAIPTSPSAPYRTVAHCRMCGSRDLQSLMDLGDMYLTGVFPSDPSMAVAKGPLHLGMCAFCGLVQLLHSYDPGLLYGAHYGYRSSLNQSMVRHLRAKAEQLAASANLRPGDLILDIGSNDGTLLSSYPENIYTLVGFDPSIVKFKEYYRSDAIAIPEFFSASNFDTKFGNRKAKIVTSIAMFYDLEEPLTFMQEVADVLAADGIWHFEQSYLPSMLNMTAYDTICHEHVEYYALHQIKWMTDRSNLKIIDISLNDINGGSFAITVSRMDSPYPEATAVIDRLLHEEDIIGVSRESTFVSFRKRAELRREQLITELAAIHAKNQTILGYGASTKGNVILQYCGLSTNYLSAIAEVNQDKYGCFTPGTNIPIISEDAARQLNPDYYLVLPWHFRQNIVTREAEFLNQGGQLLFPLPEVVGVAR